ncbi:WXG100 family type VII secretion target [Nonomuraea sp. NPDC050536]|uniref:WXG100 family type VII secretion target n=1 Tax=Nonomuraea sp. NPDC050536 TaxID=3364366 RepID=UPI0037C67794
MGSKREELVIWASAIPQGAEVNKSKAEIEKLLGDTEPLMIDDAGFAYMHASSAVQAITKALEEQHAKLAEVWEGPTAAEVQTALRLLHATGNELSTKMDQMSTALRLYAQEVPIALQKVQDIKTDLKEKDGTYSSVSMAIADSYLPLGPKQDSADIQARKVMYELNQKISNIYAVNVPYSVTYEVPIVSSPSGDPNQTPVVYPESSQDDGWHPGKYTPVEKSHVTDPGHRTTAPGTNGHDTTGGHDQSDKPGGTDHTGTGQDDGSTGSDHHTGDNGGTDHSGGTDQNGTNPDGTNPDGSHSDNAAGQPQGVTSTTSHDRQTTVPSVIDHNARQSQVATFTPHTVATPYTPTTYTPTYTATPNTLITPNSATPSVPSVLGEPAPFAGNGLTAAGARGLANGNGMSPWLPMGGGGGEGESFEHTPDLKGDPNDWTASHTVTEPRIG